MSQRRRDAKEPPRQHQSTTVKEDIELQLDSLKDPDFMADIEGLSLSVPTIAGLVFGLTALIIAIVASAMLGQFYRTQLNRNSNTNEDIVALQALVDSILPLPPRTGRFSDAEFSILNFENLNKSFCFDAGNLTSGQKRLYTTPNKKGTLALVKQIPTNIAPFDATYLTLTVNPILINERTLEFNVSNFRVNDAGPGNAYTVDMAPTPAFVTEYNRANVTLDSKGRVIFAVTNLDPNATVYFDNAFRVFDEGNPMKKAGFFLGNLNVTTTVILSVQDASGTIAYLGDIPTEFFDDVFAIHNAIITNKQVMLDCSGIGSGVLRTMTVQDADGTIAYLSDITAPFLDSEFSIFDNLQATKQARFDAANISLATTRTFAFPNLDGVLALTSGPQTFTDKTIQGATNLVDVGRLKTTGLPVNVKNAAPPFPGDVLTALNATFASWQPMPVLIRSGSWVPVLSNFVNMSPGGSSASVFAMWQQIGTRVYASVQWQNLLPQGPPPFFTVFMSFRITLPIARTSGNFVANNEASGLAYMSTTPVVSPDFMYTGTTESVSGTMQLKIQWKMSQKPPSNAFLNFMYNL